MEVRPRLLAVYLGIGLIILAASVLAAVVLRRADADAERIVQNVSKHASIVARLRQEFLLIRVAEKNLIIEDTQEGMDVFEGRITASESQIDTLLKEFGPHDAEPAVADRLREFRAGFADFRVSLREMTRLSREHTVAEAAELSRGPGRDLFQQARAVLMSLIERNREVIVARAGQPESAADIERLTRLLGTARSALEELHDLLYDEQAILAVNSTAERASIIARLESRESAIKDLANRLHESPDPRDQADADAFNLLFTQWSAGSKEVRRLAQEDTKARAMALSTSAVRDAYLRASQALDGLMRESEESIISLQHAQERALATSRSVLIATAVAGLIVIALTAWVVVHVVLREYRAAAELLVRGN